MKKRRSMPAVLFGMILSVIICVTALAGTQPRLADEAGLLSESEEAALCSKLDHISERQQMDIVVVTVDDIGDSTPEMYSEDYYNSHDYRPDGILLLVSMEERDLWIFTAGYGMIAITDADREYLFDQFQPLLSDGDYVAGFTAYADLCDELIADDAVALSTSGEPFHGMSNLMVSLLIGLAAAFLVTAFMKSQLKSVRFQPAAEGYMKSGSMNVTEAGELFLYRHVDRRARPKNNTSGTSGTSRTSHTHASSSGTSHGGGGRKF